MANTKEKLVIGGLRRLLNGTARMSRKQAGKIGYYLLTKPRRFPEDPSNESFLRGADQSTVHFNGTNVHCYHWPGKGPRVLLLHGWESYTGRWYELFDPLVQAGYDIYAFDAPAHGRSGGKRFNVFLYCQAIDVYLDHLGFVPDYWIGHSGGGMAAIYYASQADYAHEPRHIISMAVPGELENFVDKFCEIVGANERVKHGIDYQFQRKLDRSFADINFKEFVKGLKVPGLIIHDEEDDVAPIAGARLMHQNWEGSRLATTRGCGHSLTGPLVPAIVIEYIRSTQTAPALAGK